MKQIITTIILLASINFSKENRIDLIDFNQIPTVSTQSKIIIGVIDINPINWNSNRSLYKSAYQFETNPTSHFDKHGQAVIDQIIATVESQNPNAYEKIEIAYCQIEESMILTDCLNKMSQIPNLSLLNISVRVGPDLIDEEEIIALLFLSDKVKITVSAGNDAYRVEEVQALCMFNSPNIYCVGGISDEFPYSLSERSNYGKLVNAYAPFKGNVLLETKDGDSILFNGTSSSAPTFLAYIINKSIQDRFVKN